MDIYRRINQLGIEDVYKPDELSVSHENLLEIWKVTAEDSELHCEMSWRYMAKLYSRQIG